MKKYLLSIMACAASLAMYGQTSVPTSWACDSGTPPTGWTFNQTGGSGATNYTASASCDNSSSLRLDADNEALIIFFGEQPGAFSYQIGGTAGGGPTAWVGVFSIDESVDGNTWVNIKTYQIEGELPLGACLNETYNFSNTASRYLRFFYTDKQTGCNLRLDEISVIAPIVSSASISVNQLPAANTILNGSISDPFTTNTVSFNITNDGTTEVLTVSAVNVSGPYTLISPTLPFDVNTGSSTPLVFSFTPTLPGTNIGGVSIESNDSDDPTFDFALYGVNGTFATQPTGEIITGTATGEDLKTYRLVYNYQGTLLDQDPLGGYLVLRSENGVVTTAPTDGVNYQRGQSIGNAKVVFAGRPASDLQAIRTNWVQAGKTYNFAAFSYSGSGDVTNYTNQINNVALTTPATQVSPSEYTGISTSAATFVTDLHNLISPHTSIFYSNYASTMINLYLVRDTFATVGATTFNRVINCSYSGETRLFNDPFDWTGLGYSREHTFPHSWMPSFPADNPEQPEYNDQHNLYPTRQTNVNDVRCNYPFGEVVTQESVYLEGKLGLDANGKRVYEPRDSHKGRAARALMYEATCYNTASLAFNFNRPNGLTCSGTAINYPQDQNLIKKWHIMFPPDNFDMGRNDFLDSLQTNRNPFVDQPDYACFIDFSNMTKIESPADPCYTTGVEKINNMHLAAYPNPNNGTFRVSFKGSGETLQLAIVDVTGKVVYSKSIGASSEVNIIDLDSQFISAGIYMMTLRGAKSHASTPIIVTH